MPQGLSSWVRLAITGATRAIGVALALPRIAIALERIADATDDVRRLADVTPAIEILATMAGDAKRLIGDPARYDEFLAVLTAIVRLGEAAATIGPLGEAVKQLNAATTALTTTMTPLQGASERLGRMVDRLPSGRSRQPTAEPDLG